MLADTSVSRSFTEVSYLLVGLLLEGCISNSEWPIAAIANEMEKSFMKAMTVLNVPMKASAERNQSGAVREGKPLWPLSVRTQSVYRQNIVFMRQQRSSHLSSVAQHTRKRMDRCPVSEAPSSPRWIAGI